MYRIDVCLIVEAGIQSPSHINLALLLVCVVCFSGRKLMEAVLLCLSDHLNNVVMVQEGQLMSFGRGTYGRIGRQDVDPKADDCHPEAKRVDNLEDVAVSGMAAGEVHPIFPQCLALTVSICVTWKQPYGTVIALYLLCGQHFCACNTSMFHLRRC